MIKITFIVAEIHFWEKQSRIMIPVLNIVRVLADIKLVRLSF